ncbi:hypothetical protein ACIRPK_12085 [Kitasatospora sp. NPDC101801]|uniref:hypothetical protein n=1 Tax=Kitasatospora sp. NPDC101801 TaxID=3364103 RepID=UPI00380D99CD
MSSQLLQPEERSGVPPLGSAPGRGARGRRWALLAGALAASWVLPVVLDALNLDIVLIPVFVLGVASLLRVGGGLLDRLVIATFVLCGGLLAFGLVLSLWPWGMQPVPTSGVILSVLSIASWASGRAPRLPLRFRVSDLVILGTGAFVWHYIHHPLVGRSVIGRLPFALSIEDRIVHFSIFDAIHQFGGFLFFHQDAAKVLVPTPTEAVYPQGSHFLLAWFDIFVRSDTATGDPGTAYGRYYVYVLASFAILCALVVWGARWIGGPRLTGWRTAAVCTVVAGLTVASPLGAMVKTGFDSQIAGVMFLAVAIPLIVRPAMSWATYAAVSVAALITVAYTYNILAAFVGIALVIAAWVYRRRQARHRWVLYAIQAAGCAVALLPSVMSVMGTFDVEAQAQARGMLLPFDRSLTVGLALLIAVVFLVAGRRRTGVGMTLLGTVAGGALVLGVFGVWQMRTIGTLPYYFEKLATGGFVICLLGLGTVGTLLRPLGPWTTAFRKRWWVEGVASVAAFAAGLSLFAGIQWGVPSVNSGPTAWSASSLAEWSKEKGGNLAPYTTALATRDIARVEPGTPVVTLYSNDAYLNWKLSFFATTLVHRGGLAAKYPDLFNVYIGGAPVDKAQYENSLASLKKAIELMPAEDRKVSVLVADARTADDLRRDLGSLKDRTVTVLHTPIQG